MKKLAAQLNLTADVMVRYRRLSYVTRRGLLDWMIDGMSTTQRDALFVQGFALLAASQSAQMLEAIGRYEQAPRPD